TEGEEATSVAFRPAALAMTGARAQSAGPASDLEATRVEVPSAAGSAQLGSEARSSTTMSSDDLEDTQTQAFDWRTHPLRRYVPHAAAALVLLGLGGALVSALGGDDEADSAVAALEKPAELTA